MRLASTFLNFKTLISSLKYLNARYFLLLFFSFFILNPSSALAQRGGSCGCGGSVVTLPNGNTILLDLLTLNPALANPRQRTASGSNTPCTPPSTPNGLTHISLAEDIRTKDAYEFLLARLELWKESSPALVQTIRDSLQNMSFSRTPSAFAPLPESFTFPAVITPAMRASFKITTSILYTPEHGAIISDRDPSWDPAGCHPLDTPTKAGLLLHEVLRQVQHLYQQSLITGTERDHDFTDTRLQSVTAQIMTRVPGNGRNQIQLETAAHLGSSLAYQMMLTRRTLPHRQNLDRFRDKFCREIGTWFRESNLGQQTSRCEIAQNAASRYNDYFFTPLPMFRQALLVRFDPRRLQGLKDDACSPALGPLTFDWIVPTVHELGRCIYAEDLSARRREICSQVLSHETLADDLIAATADRSASRGIVQGQENLLRSFIQGERAICAQENPAEQLRLWEQLVRENILLPERSRAE